MRPVMNSGDVAEKPGFTHQADSAGIFTSGFVFDTVFAEEGRVHVIKNRVKENKLTKKTSTCSLNLNIDPDVDIWSIKHTDSDSGIALLPYCFVTML